MKEIVRSVGTLAMWWVVGSAIQVAAWALRDAEDDATTVEDGADGDAPHLRLVA